MIALQQQPLENDSARQQIRFLGSNCLLPTDMEDILVFRLRKKTGPGDAFLVSRHLEDPEGQRKGPVFLAALGLNQRGHSTTLPD
jgi:hypothetical protein